RAAIDRARWSGLEGGRLAGKRRLNGRDRIDLTLGGSLLAARVAIEGPTENQLAFLVDYVSLRGATGVEGPADLAVNVAENGQVGTIGFGGAQGGGAGLLLTAVAGVDQQQRDILALKLAGDPAQRGLAVVAHDEGAIGVGPDERNHLALVV